MDVNMAAEVINTSLIAHYPPVFILGDNGIGKTELLKYMAKKRKNTLFTTGIDYGGLKKFISEGNIKIKNIILSDIQSILSRKMNVFNATFGYISTLVEEGASTELVYNVATNDVKSKHYNFIVAGTPHHFVRLVRLGQYDFLSRFVYLYLERDLRYVDINKPFKLNTELPHKLDKIKVALDIDLINKQKNIRFKKMANEFVKSSLELGYDKNHVEEVLKNLLFFNNIDVESHNWEEIFRKSLKPIK